MVAVLECGLVVALFHERGGPDEQRLAVRWIGLQFLGGNSDQIVDVEQALQLVRRNYERAALGGEAVAE